VFAVLGFIGKPVESRLQSFAKNLIRFVWMDWKCFGSQKCLHTAKYNYMTKSGLATLKTRSLLDRNNRQSHGWRWFVVVKIPCRQDQDKSLAPGWTGASENLPPWTVVTEFRETWTVVAANAPPWRVAKLGQLSEFSVRSNDCSRRAEFGNDCSRGQVFASASPARSQRNTPMQNS